MGRTDSLRTFGADVEEPVTTLDYGCVLERNLPGLFRHKPSSRVYGRVEHTLSDMLSAQSVYEPTSRFRVQVGLN